MAEYAIYFLHFAEKVGRVQHYVGITHADRIEQRLKEHAVGNGARLTSMAAKRNVKMFLARVMLCDDPAREKQIKRTGHIHSYCPICCAQGQIDFSHRVINPLERPAQPEAQNLLTWREAAPTCS